MRLRFLFVLAAFLIIHAAPSRADIPDSLPVLKQMEAEGAKVGALGKSYGLEGWIVINPKGEVQYVYTTPEGAMVTGMLFAPDGSMETAKQLLAYQEKAGMARTDPPLMPKSERLYAALEKSNWVALGNAKAPPVYAVINVACDHCIEFWKDIEHAVTEGKVQVRLVPYGSVEENRDGGAALLAAKNPNQAWRAYIDGDEAALALKESGKDSYVKIDSNTALTKEWRLPGPPFILYRRPSDAALTAIAGRPENIAQLVSEFAKKKDF